MVIKTAYAKSFMILIEPYEARLLLEALLKIRREYEMNELPVREIDHLMWEIMLHAGLSWAERTVPEAYKICFPEGAPRISRP